MNPQIVQSTIAKWIRSCENKEQLGVAHEAVIKLFDWQFKAQGTRDSEELHNLCFAMKSSIEKGTIEETDPLNLDVPGKD